MTNKTETKNKEIYYNWRRALSYNALFHIIITERNLGKTYGFLIKMMKWTYYKKKKGIMLTKYVNELDGGKEDYSVGIFNTMNNILLDPKVHDFDGLEIELTKEKNHIYLNGDICCSFYPINRAERMKKITELKEYDYIVHDEFLTLGQYVPKETDKVLTIYETVDRRKNTTKLFLLGNALSRYNPYMEEWNLPLDVNGFLYLKDRKFLIHVSNNVEFQKSRLISAISKLGGDKSEYIKMAQKNIFVYDEDDYVQDIPKAELISHRFGLIINEKKYTLSMFENGFYIHDKVLHNKYYHNKRPSLISRNMNRETLKQVKSLYFNGLLYYQNIEIKSNFIKEFIKE